MADILANSSSSTASSSAKTVALDTYGASGASTPGANHSEVVLSLTAMSPGTIHDSTPTGKEDYQTNVDDDETSLVISNAAPRTPSYAQNPSAHTPASVAPRQNGDLTRSPSFVAHSGSPEGSPTDGASPLPPQDLVASPQESLIAPPTNPEVCSLTSSIYDALPYDALPCEAQPLLLQRDGCVADDQISVFSHQSDYSQGHARPPSANAHSRQLRPNHVPAPPPVPELCSPDHAEDPATPSDPAPSPPRPFASPSASQGTTSQAPAPVTSSQTVNPAKPSHSLESPTLAPPGAAPTPPHDTPLPAPQAPQRQADVPASTHHSPVLTSAHLTPVPASSHHILAASHSSHMPASSHHTHAPAMPYHTHVPAMPHHCHVPTSAHLVPVSPPAHYTQVMAPPPYSPAPSPPTSYFASIPAHHVSMNAPHYSVSASVPLSASSPVSMPPPPYQFAAPAPVSVAVLNPQQRTPAPWHHAPPLAQPPMPCPYHHAQKQQQQPGQDAGQYQGTMPPEQLARPKNQHDAWYGLSGGLPDPPLAYATLGPQGRRGAPSQFASLQRPRPACTHAHQSPPSQLRAAQRPFTHDEDCERRTASVGHQSAPHHISGASCRRSSFHGSLHREPPAHAPQPAPQPAHRIENQGKNDPHGLPPSSAPRGKPASPQGSFRSPASSPVSAPAPRSSPEARTAFTPVRRPRFPHDFVRHGGSFKGRPSAKGEEPQADSVAMTSSASKR
ncbi:extensin-like [Penaeus chinensis]|uniref:extensin-like n=1 Tax=Penaeus chinensis TaxID=139456 RepID=UPI001FB828D6|nr:extensin-like [Penaeus chinensis]